MEAGRCRSQASGRGPGPALVALSPAVIGLSLVRPAVGAAAARLRADKSLRVCPLWLCGSDRPVGLWESLEAGPVRPWLLLLMIRFGEIVLNHLPVDFLRIPQNRSIWGWFCPHSPAWAGSPRVARTRGLSPRRCLLATQWLLGCGDVLTTLRSHGHR